MMKIIHTSDWHLGQNFMFKDRKKEHAEFLDWLLELIKKESVDALIIAGDIFDTISPPNYALKLYYSFLAGVSSTTACDTVIIGGNHDSVSTLNAPKGILKALNVHVTGGISSDISNEIIVVTNSFGKPGAIICAVPFLRDRDIRKSMAGETFKEKSKALIDGIKNHYALAKDAALKKRAEIVDKNGIKIPILATGHLFTEGSKINEDEGIRDIYVGTLGHVSLSTFPNEFDYVALGHLHRPQKIGGNNHIRYSGAPIPLSFSEAGNEKQVICISFEENNEKPGITTFIIPEFQKLRRARGSLDEVIDQLKAFRLETPQKSIWVEVSILEKKWRPDIESIINDLAQELSLDILALKNLKTSQDKRFKKTSPSETLDNYTPKAVFEKRVEKEGSLEDGMKEELMHAFNEIMNSVNQNMGKPHENP